ncbi:MAG: DUF4184 family protein [Promethearchaeota archaeon]
MPSSILSRQAPLFPLKIKFPKKFDGTALFFGALIPDFNFIVDFFYPVNFYGFTHSLIGQFFWTIPLTVLATLIFSQFIGPFCAKIASCDSKIFFLLKYFGVDQWYLLKRKKFNRKFWFTSTLSALLGGISHLLLDWPSHAHVYILYPWIVWLNPYFLLHPIFDFGSFSIGPFKFEWYFRVCSLLWVLQTILGFILALYFLRYIKNNDLVSKWYGDMK